MSQFSSAATLRCRRRGIPAARGLLFIGIVWSVAGAFLTLEFGSARILEGLIQAEWLPADVFMPKPLAQDDICSAQSSLAEEPSPRGPADPATAPHIRYAIWQFAQLFGFAAARASAGSSPEDLAPLLERVSVLAAALGLPRPSLPETKHIANGLHEFQVYLQADPECLGARLASQYGPHSTSVFRFGAAIGHALPFQASGVGAALVPEIRHYGELAGVPRELWLPMTQDLSSISPGNDPQTKAFEIVRQLDEYMMGD